MHFTPLTEEELQVADLLPDGAYDYKVLKSEDRVSQSGNEYIALTLLIKTNEGKTHLVFTNLALIKLLKHFCDVNSMQDFYNSGDVAAFRCMDMAGGRVLIGTEPEKPNPNGGVYRAKNIVKDYIASPNGSSLKPLPDSDFTNDEIPF